MNVYDCLFCIEAIMSTYMDKMEMKNLRVLYSKKGKIYFFYHKNLAILSVLLPLIVVMGFRYEIGVDYKSYERIFYQINLFNESCYMEPGYYLLNRLIGKFTDNPQILFLCVSILINVILLKAIIHSQGKVYYGILSFMGLGYYFYAMNIQRQYIAIMIVFYGFPFLEHKEFKKFLITILLAAIFHTSALIMPVVYIVVHFLGKKGKRYYIISFLSMLGLVLLREIVLILLTRMNFYRRQIQEVSQLIGTGRPSGVNIAISGVFIALCIIYYRRIIKIREENRTRIKLLWLLFLIQIFLWKFGGAASRIAAYLCPVYLLLLSDLVECIPVKYRGWIKAMVGVCLYCFMNIIINYGGNAAHHFLPYQFRIS